MSTVADLRDQIVALVHKHVAHGQKEPLLEELDALLAGTPATQKDDDRYLSEVADRILECGGAVAHDWLRGVARHLKDLAGTPPAGAQEGLTALVAEVRHIHERECALRDNPDPTVPETARAWSLGAAFVTGYVLPKLDALLAAPSSSSIPAEPADKIIYPNGMDPNISMGPGD